MLLDSLAGDHVSRSLLLILQVEVFSCSEIVMFSEFVCDLHWSERGRMSAI